MGVSDVPWRKPENLDNVVYGIEGPEALIAAVRGCEAASRTTKKLQRLKANDVSVLEGLILQFIQWLAKRERTHEEGMEAWRTSCPRLPIVKMPRIVDSS